MEFRGFNHNLHILLNKTISKLITFKIDPLRLEILKDKVSFK